MRNFLPLGSQFGMDFVIGYGRILGSPYDLYTRPPVPEDIMVTHHILRPPVGIVVTVPLPAEPALQMDKTVTPGGGGFTFSFSVPNAFAEIFYTLNGVDPVNGESATNFVYTGPFFVGPPDFPSGTIVTVKARAFGVAGFSPSAVSTDVVTIP